MALKNLFDMVKADRYTADGREELIKAQEAETEDKVYQIGEISQKTGLQKTANGWVKPKKNKEIQNAGKHAESVKAAQKAKKEEARRQQRAEGEANARAFQEKVEKGEIKPDGAEVHQQQGEEIKGNLEAAKYYFDKAQSFSPTDPSYKTYMTKAKQYNDEAKAQADDNGFDFEEMHNSGVTQAVNKYAEEQSKPAAQEVKLGGGADTYYFEDPDNMSNEDKVFKSLGIELAETFGDHDGEPGNTETWANGWLDNIMENGGLGIKSKKTRQPAAPVPAEEVMRVVEENPARWDRIIGNAKKFYEGKGRSTDFESDEFYPIKLVGGKTKPSAQYYAEGKRNKKNNPLTGKYVTQRQNTSKDAAPSLSEIVDRVYNIGEISEKTGLQKTANGWRPVKKGAAGKTSRANKEEAIRKDLGLTEGEDMSRFSDEQIEKMYAKTQQTPEQQKADFDKSKIGHAVNKGRQEFAAEKARQKELASKTNAIGLPKENKPGAGIPTYKESDFIGKTYGDFAKTLPRGQYTITRNQENPDGSSENDFTDIKHGGKKITVKFDKEGKITSVKQHENPTRSYEVGANNQATETKPAAPVKRNEAEKVKHSDGTESYRIKGTQFYFNTPEEAESALLAESRYGKTYATASKDPEINNIQEALGFELDMHGSGKSMDKFMKKIGENEYAANVWAFGTDSKGTMINPLDETDKPNSVIKKENGEWKLHYKGRDGKEIVVTANGRQDPTSDSAPRQLTGDCRIRIRKEKPALTGDTKIRVRK